MTEHRERGAAGAAYESSNSVGLLISVLLSYPEIATMRFCPDSRCLRFAFMLSKSVTSRQFSSFKAWFEESLRVLSDLTKNQLTVLEVTRTEAEDFCMLEVKRDIESLTREEISLISSLVDDRFGQDLISESGEALSKEDQRVQEELIDQMLEDFRESAHERVLVGFREDGRVLVFNKDATQARES